jgi:hypothetical protein
MQAGCLSDPVCEPHSLSAWRSTGRERGGVFRGGWGGGFWGADLGRGSVVSEREGFQ